MPREPMQLSLFRRLPVPKDQPTPRNRPPRSRSPVLAALQLAFSFVLRPLSSDGDTEYDYPVQRVVKVEDADPIRPPVVRSIFDVGVNVEELQSMARMLTSNGRTGRCEVFRRVQRDEGRQEVIGAMYPAARWTPEREEQERARRARQKPPKPVKKARTRSKKLLELIGGGADQE